MLKLAQSIRISGLLLCLLVSLALTTRAETITLDVYALMPQTTIDQITAAYKKHRPDVELVWSNTGGGIDAAVSRILGGVGPDILYWGDEGQDLLDSGTFLVLDPYIQRDGIEIPAWARMPNAVERNGKVYGLPWFGFIGMFMYNKTLFDQAGVAAPNDSWTWDHLISEGRKLTRIAGDGTYERRGVQLSSRFNPGGWTDFIAQNDARLFNEEMTEFLPDVEASVEALEFARSLAHEYQVMDPSLPGYDSRDPFDDGAVAMRYDVSSWLAWMVEKSLPFEWDLAPMPKGKQRISELTLGTAAINAQTKHPEEAWEFVRWATTEEGLRIVAQTFRAVPPNADILFSEWYLDEISDLNIRVLAEQMVSSRFHRRPANTSSILGIINDTVERMVWGGEIPVESGVEQIRAQVNPMLRELAGR